MIRKNLLCILACISLIIMGSGCTTSKTDPRIPETNTTQRAASDHGLVDYPINELPMYGKRKKTDRQKRADDKYVKDMTNHYGSRETAADVAAKLGWNVFYKGDKTLAIKRFNQAWLLDHLNQYALWGFAVISQERGQLGEAIRYYRIAIENGPKNTSLQRDYENALKLLNQ